MLKVLNPFCNNRWSKALEDVLLQTEFPLAKVKIVPPLAADVCGGGAALGGQPTCTIFLSGVGYPVGCCEQRCKGR